MPRDSPLTDGAMEESGFKSGDLVYWVPRDVVGVVRNLKQGPAGPMYEVALPGPWYVQTIPLRDLQVFRNPWECLLRGECEEPLALQLRLRALRLLYAYKYEGLSCLSNSRLDLMPHQVFIAHRVASQLEPRFLFADEPGLGKTIEAGLVLKELRARGLLNRVLIVVPAGLISQWKRELENKFNEKFVIYNFHTVAYLRTSSPDQNVWSLHDNIICSLQFARGEQQRKLIADLGWDLIIFDEAHHLRRYRQRKKKRTMATIGEEYEERATLAYRLGAAVAAKCPSLLLLTATPLQLHDYEFYSLLELLDESLFKDYDSFCERRECIKVLNQFATLVSTFSSISPEKKALLARFLGRAVREMGDLISKSPKMTVDEQVDAVESLNRRLAGSVWVLPLGREREPTLSDVLSPNYPNVDSKSVATSLVRAVEVGVGDSGFSNVEPSRWMELLEDGDSREAILNALRNSSDFSKLMIRNRKREVIRDLLTDRRAFLRSVNMTDKEWALYRNVTEYVQYNYARAKETRDQALGFVMVTFQRLLTSSSRALAKSLESRLRKIQKSLVEKRGRRFSEDQLEEIEDSLESVEDMQEVIDAGASEEEATLKEIRALNGLLADADAVEQDSKALKLVEELRAIFSAQRDKGREKALIFTQFVETMNYLATVLAKEGYKVEKFYGGMDSEAKDQAVKSFSRDSEILISTEAGGEGRNFQFCHIMFNYDLPWNPMKIEQRIGRLDRIGQKKDVLIFNFALADTLEGRIIDVLQNRLKIFEETVGTLDPILGQETEQRITELLLHRGNDEAVNRFAADSEAKIRAAREAEEKMNDFLMDTTSFRREKADEILGRVSALTNCQIESLTKDFLARYPSSKVTQIGATKTYRIGVPDAFREDCKRRLARVLGPNQAPYVLAGTFDPKTAIDDESLDFIAFGHPLFEAIVDFCTQPRRHGRFQGEASKMALRSPTLAGTMGYIFVYELHFLGISEHRKLVPVFITLSGSQVSGTEAMEAILDCDARALQTTSFQPSFSDTDQSPSERAESLIREMLQNEEEAFLRRNETEYEYKSRKCQRLRDYRNEKIKREQQRAWGILANLRVSSNAEERRVIPVWEARAKEEERKLAELKETAEQEQKALENRRKITQSYKMLCCALVQFL